MSSVTLIFVAFNSAHLMAAHLPQLANTPIVIIDNASSDDLAAVVAQHANDKVQYIRNDLNVGYGRAVNQAMAQVKTPLAMLANPDLSVTEDTLAALVEATELLNQPWLFVAPQTGEQPTMSDTQHGRLPAITWASGSAMLFNVEVFNRLGGFDEQLFLFFEETDFCLRAEQAGIAMHYASEVSMPHAIGESVAASQHLSWLKDWHYQWSRLYFYKKHRMHKALFSQYAKVLLGYPLRLKRLKVGTKKHHDLSVRLSATRAFLAGQQAFDDHGIAAYTQPFTAEQP